MILNGKVVTAACLLALAVAFNACGGTSTPDSPTATIVVATPTASALSTAERDDKCYQAGWLFGYGRAQVPDIVSPEKVTASNDALKTVLAYFFQELFKNLPIRQQERCSRIAQEGTGAGFLAYNAGAGIDTLPEHYAP